MFSLQYAEHIFLQKNTSKVHRHAAEYAADRGKGDITLKKVIKWFSIFAVIGTAIGLAVAYFCKNNSDSPEENASDHTEEEDFDLDADLKPASGREYVSLGKDPESADRQDTAEGDARKEEEESSEEGAPRKSEETASEEPKQE